MESYYKEFNVTPEEVEKEVGQIQKEKKIQYDDYGQAVPKRSYYQELRDKPCGQGKTALVKKEVKPKVS